MILPKLVTRLRGYDRAQFANDAAAGVIVGIVALPLAIAFAIASGVGPQAGLYTAIIAGFLISALSGSRVQIGGPTGAFIVIVYRIVQQHGVDGLTVATIMAGIILIALGKSDLLDEIGEDNLVPTLDAAKVRARKLMALRTTGSHLAARR